MMERDSSKNRTFARDMLFFGLLVLAGAVFILFYLAIFGNENQVYTDVVQEWTSADSSNKSAEVNLVYALSILGAIAYATYYLASNWAQVRKEELAIRTNSETKAGMGNSCFAGELIPTLAILLLTIFVSILYFVYSAVNPLLVGALLIALISATFGLEFVAYSVCLFFMSAYGICGLYRLVVALGYTKPFTTIEVSALALITCLVCLGFRDRRNALFRGLLVSQIALPFTLLLYLMNSYWHDGIASTISVPLRVQIPIICLIVAFVAEALVLLKKRWRRPSSLNAAIAFGACVCIMAFNRFSGTGSILSTDLHHPYENIIGFSQIFELGQQPFSEYVPISGMYSVLQGLFLEVFGKGLAANYFLTQNLFYLCFILVVVILLRANLKGGFAFLIALIFPVLDYNRIAFLLPALLLLSMPFLLERKNLWLKMWMLTSVVAVLNYPANGAAICLGFMPLAIWQVTTFIRNGDFKLAIRRPSFWIGWAACALAISISLPLVFGMLRHALSMGGITAVREGISRFGSEVPENFFGYLDSDGLRLALFYIATFLPLVLVVWVSVAMLFRLGKCSMGMPNRKFDRRLPLNGKVAGGMSICFRNPVAGLLSISIAILLLVTYSYTLIRIGIHSIYARSGGVIYAVAVFIALLAIRYRASRYRSLALIGFAALLIAIPSGEALLGVGLSPHLEPAYEVPEGYLYIEDGQVERLGTSFVDPATLESIQSSQEMLESLDRDESYFGAFGSFGTFFFAGAKGDSLVESTNVKGLTQTLSAIDLFKRNDTVIGNVSSYGSYYLYNWLMTSGQYVWDDGDGVFRPNTQGLPIDQVLEINGRAENANKNLSMGRTASSWGLSIESLSDVLTDVEIGYSIRNLKDGVEIVFDDVLNGDEADFVYLEFEGMDEIFDYILFNHTTDDNVISPDLPGAQLRKKDWNRDVSVELAWIGDDGTSRTIDALIGQGKLLVPLGSVQGWLLEEHGAISIKANRDGNPIALPEISVIEFLKLREVE